MNKIINWTIGSFFRTIGRIIAYIGIGIVITYILSNSNINWGGITELFFDKVDALSLDGQLAQETALFNTGVKQVFDQEMDGNTHTQIIYFDYNYANATHNYMVIPLTGFQWQYSDIWTPATSEYTQQLNLNMYLSVKLIPTSGSWMSCEFQNNLLVCPMQNMSTYTGLEFKFKATTQLTGYMFDINQWVWIYDKDTTTTNNAINNNTNAIQNQTQQQQQQHEEMMDDNTTQAESEATDFFEDFDAPDIGGLGAIITAPLNTIRSLLNSSCTNLVLPLPFVNQNLTLPCMNTIYTQHFGAFFTIYQTIILAIIAYRCIRSIFFDIHGFTNPNDDRIEVMDL